MKAVGIYAFMLLSMLFIISISSYPVSAEQCWSGKQLSMSELASLVKNNFPAGVVATTGEDIQVVAYAVARAESCGGYPTACGDCGKEPGCFLCHDSDNPGISSIGLWQIDLAWWPMYIRSWLFDPNNNAKAALAISENGQNWYKWSVYKSGAYMKWIPEAKEALGILQASDDNKIMPTSAQVSLNIYVTDGGTNGAPLSGVQVTGQDATGNSFVGTTDSNGAVNVSGWPGTWQFTISKEGYDTSSFNFDVTAAYNASTGTYNAFYSLQRAKGN